jgi:hypothetical protein
MTDKLVEQLPRLTEDAVVRLHAVKCSQWLDVSEGSEIAVRRETVHVVAPFGAGAHVFLTNGVHLYVQESYESVVALLNHESEGAKKALALLAKEMSDTL